MSLSWNEIKKRAIEFSQEWAEETREDAEAKSFWDGFFNIFGITRRRLASFEEPVKKLGKEYGYIDLFWKSNLIVEHKSKGKDLDKAYSQAIGYFPGLEESDLPKYVLVSDFSRFKLYDIEQDTYQEFLLKDLSKNIHHFGFILGYTKKSYKDEDPVNIEAAEMMGKLHDALFESGYTGHQLEIFLVRILFCLFADDTGIFSKDHFSFYLENRTKQDGSDLGMQLAFIFQVLNTPNEQRQHNLDEDVAVLPFVNGSLFKEVLAVPSFDSEMRKTLLNCCQFDWNRISPAIFGSMFQSVMDREKRRNLGAHYTSEKNILKVVKGLFLDELYEEFELCKANIKKLGQFHEKISKLKFFDPACGCGNFLIITYREIRLLEIKILKEIYKLSKKSQLELDVQIISKIDVDSMYGIEIEEFPARIAEVALWLIDHQCNMRLSEEFGQYYVRLPLKKSPNIVHGNALRLDWSKLSESIFDFILGNPPFVAKKNRSKEQNSDMDLVCNQIKNYGLLDYICCWYIKASDYIQDQKTKVAFVSTNSITQGEQVGVLWNHLFKKNIKIHFTHRTFKWTNEARGKAQVFVVIISFANYDTKNKLLYDYETPKSEAMEIQAKNINPYLIDFADVVLINRNTPICNVPQITFGSMPNDDGNFLFTDEEKEEFLKKQPKAKKYIKPLISAKEFLNGEKRWCLWLVNISPAEIRALPEVQKRIENVKKYRLKSERATTVSLADYPNLFGEIRQPKSNYILIPRHSSEHRKYIPIGFFDNNSIASDSCVIIPFASFYHFGVITSLMHNAWMRQVCGRLKSDYRYSNKLVYNNFPWPEKPTSEQVKEVENAVRRMLKVRDEYLQKSSTLADLYDPLARPKTLVDAHKEIDEAVDKCYGFNARNASELRRLGFLFELYEKYTNPLIAVGKKKRKK